MTVIAKILEQNADLAGRCEVKKIALEVQSVFVGSNEMCDQVFMGRAVVENFDVLRGLDIDPGVACAQGGCTEEKESSYAELDPLECCGCYSRASIQSTVNAICGSVRTTDSRRFRSAEHSGT